MSAGHRVVVGVEHPARLLREVDARRAEDVDQLVAPGSTARVVWIEGGGMTAIEGVAQMLVLVLAPHAFMLGVHGQRISWMKAPSSASEHCSKSS